MDCLALFLGYLTQWAPTQWNPGVSSEELQSALLPSIPVGQYLLSSDSAGQSGHTLQEMQRPCVRDASCRSCLTGQTEGAVTPQGGESWALGQGSLHFLKVRAWCLVLGK